MRKKKEEKASNTKHVTCFRFVTSLPSLHGNRNFIVFNDCSFGVIYNNTTSKKKKIYITTQKLQNIVLGKRCIYISNSVLA